MAHRPPHVRLDQVDQLGDGGGEASDAHLLVHKDGAHAGAGQEVVHVVVGLGEFEDLLLQLGVDRVQLLVERLQLFLGGLQLLVGGLQFFVHRLHLLVYGFELFGGRFHLLEGGLEIFLLGLQFLLQRRQPGVAVRGEIDDANARPPGLSGLDLCRRRILKADQEQTGGGGCLRPVLVLHLP